MDMKAPGVVSEGPATFLPYTQPQPHAMCQMFHALPPLLTTLPTVYCASCEGFSECFPTQKRKGKLEINISTD